MLANISDDKGLVYYKTSECQTEIIKVKITYLCTPQGHMGHEVLSLQPLPPTRKEPPVPLKRRLGVVETQSVHIEKEKILTTMPGIEEDSSLFQRVTSLLRRLSR